MSATFENDQQFMPAGQNIIVDFRKVSKTYDERSWVVDNLDLSIMKGEFLSLLGPSGSGKTTTLMMLGGFEQPDRGKIIMDGADISQLPPRERDMGVVFQSYALFPHMTIEENIAFPLKVRNISRSECKSRVKDALDMVQLSHVATRRPAQLSGGQQQRIALARALVYKPRILLMDEPLGALDKALREKMQEEIKKLHTKLGITFIYVTHDQDEALTLSDRVAVFNQGKIVQIDSPTELYRSPASSFVAGFLGETNLLPATVVENIGKAIILRLTNNVEVQALSVISKPKSGDKVSLCIRPENIKLLPKGKGSFTTQITGKVFHGAHWTLTLKTDEEILLTARVTPEQFNHIDTTPGSFIDAVLPACDCLTLTD